MHSTVDPRSITIREMRTIVAKARQPKWAFLPRRVSVYITALVVRHTRITANQVTVFWGILNILTAVMLATGHPVWLLLVPLTIQLYIVFDCVDGEVARVTRSNSAAGKKLDQFFHEVFDNLSIIAVTVGSFRQTGDSGIWPLGLALFFAFNMKNRIEFIIRTSILLDAPQPQEGHQAPLTGRRRTVLGRLRGLLEYVPYKGMHAIVLLGVFGQMAVGLWIWVAVTHLRWIRDATYWLRHIDQPNRVVFLVMPTRLHERLRAKAATQGDRLGRYILTTVSHMVEDDRHASDQREAHSGVASALDAPETSVQRPVDTVGG